MFGKYLKEIRKNKNYTLESLAEAYNKKFDGGLNKGTLSKYENNKQEPMISVVDNLATLLNVDTDYLLGKATTAKKGTKIPVLGRIAAGMPIEAIEDIIDYEEITEDMSIKGNHFALQVRGDSMEPRICEGDVVIVKKQDDAESGELVIAVVNEDDATCKRLKKYKDGIMLISNNSRYEPVHYSNQQVRDLPVVIIGKVVELRGKF